MLNINEIKELIQQLDNSSLDSFTLQTESQTLVLKKNKQKVVQVAAQPIQTATPPSTPTVESGSPTQVAASAPTQAAPVQKETENLAKITSPMVGTFYAASSPDSPPFIKVGDTVQKNTVVCILEAMKLFNEIESEVEGEIVEILVGNGELVEYGQTIALVRPK